MTLHGGEGVAASAAPADITERAYKREEEKRKNSHIVKLYV